MGERNLTQRIFDQVEVASKALTCADIQRRLQGHVEPSEISCRLTQMAKRGQIIHVMVDNPATTGPRKIKAYMVPGAEIAA